MLRSDERAQKEEMTFQQIAKLENAIEDLKQDKLGQEREIAHLHSGTSFDARVPKTEQRAWKDDPRLVPRKSVSPWMEITLATDADVEDALRLVRLAAASA